MKDIAKKVVSAALTYAPPGLRTRAKELNELMFWRGRLKREGSLSNDHYERFYTETFGVDRAYYAGKRIADIGCGPRGSLEWCAEAAERVGVDPLASEYLKMGAHAHAMSYVTAGCEEIPFEDGHFDVVTALNSLDHVENVDAAVAEIERICRPGGDILIIVEINHKPTITEPHFLEKTFTERFRNCETLESRILKIRDDHDVYRSIMDDCLETDPSAEAILIARLRKNGVTLH